MSVKGSAVKLSADKWRVRWNDDTAFYSYRWLAWALAGISLTLPGHRTASLPRDAGMLLLLGVMTVAMTAMAHVYVRLARRRPLLLILDILASLAIVWLSGGEPLPFFPYALGSLVLPALLGGRLGAITAAVAFIALDLVGLALFWAPFNPNITPSLLAVRAAIPVAFAIGWVVLGRLLAYRAYPGRLAEIPPVSTSDRQVVTSDTVSPMVRLSTFSNIDRSTGISSGSGASTQQHASAHLDPTPRPDAARHAIFDPVPSEGLSFPTAIDQLALSFGRQGGVEMRVTTSGTARTLTNAQHSVLLRVAQEALLNIHQHAHAQLVLITLSFEPQAVTLAVQDDGVGLLDGTYERPGLHALRAVRYRLAEFDGQLAVVEGESGGVTLRATLPLE